MIALCTPWRILELLHARCGCARLDGPSMPADHDDDFKRLPRAQCTSPSREHGQGTSTTRDHLPAEVMATALSESRGDPPSQVPSPKTHFMARARRVLAKQRMTVHVV